LTTQVPRRLFISANMLLGAFAGEIGMLGFHGSYPKVD
jgi:hypothetical protein